MAAKIIYYDWNWDNGYVVPTLKWADNQTAYIRSDLTEDELNLDEPNVEFNTGGTVFVDASYIATYTDDGQELHLHADYENYNSCFLINLSLAYKETNAEFWKQTVKSVNSNIKFSFRADDGTTFTGTFPSYTDGPTIEYLNYDFDRSCWCFSVGESGKRFYAYANVNGTEIQACNFVYFDTENKLRILDFAKSYGAYAFYPKYRTIDYVTNEERLGYVQLHTNDVTAMIADTPVNDVANYEAELPTADDPTVTIFISNRHRTVGILSLLTSSSFPAAEVTDTTNDAADARENAINDVYNLWRTPTEYYNETQGNVPTDTANENGYMKAPTKTSRDSSSGETTTDEDENSIPTWFWCNSLANWCTFKKTEALTTELMVWNGKNGWDKFSTICTNSTTADIIMQKYYYDPDMFAKGASMSESSSKFEQRLIKLPYDTKFSQYDGNTFQTIKPTKLYMSDEQERGRFPVFAGIPVLQRLPSGELAIAYFLKMCGSETSKEFILDEMIDFINTTCMAFFGEGEDKTIADDWKVFNKIIDDAEEAATTVYTSDDSTLVNAEEINTTRVDGEALSITLSIPRQYPETADVIDDSFVERWNK